MTPTPNNEALAELVAAKKAFDSTPYREDLRPAALRLDKAWEAAESALASSGQAASAVPEGWKLVPVEPTREMELAAFDALELEGTATETGTMMRNRVYRAMLAASPTQPASAPAAPAQPREAQEQAAAMFDSVQVGALWQAFQSTSEFKHALGWCAHDDQQEGALFTAFRAGLAAALSTPPAPRAPSIEPVREVSEAARAWLRKAFEGRQFRVPETLDESIKSAANCMLEDWLILESYKRKLAAPAGAGVEEFPLPELPETVFLDYCNFGYNAESLREYARAALRSYSASLGLQARTEGKV